MGQSEQTILYGQWRKYKKGTHHCGNHIKQGEILNGDFTGV